MTDEHKHAMKVAKVIAKTMGDNFSDAFKNKQRWTAKRGMSGGRFRDVNEPFQDDYIAAAQAAAAVIAADRAGLVAEIERLREALIDAGSSLAAAISLLERGGKAAKRAAPSDAMFNQMIRDYTNSLKRARAALGAKP